MIRLNKPDLIDLRRVAQAAMLANGIVVLAADPGSGALSPECAFKVLMLDHTLQ